MGQCNAKECRLCGPRPEDSADLHDQREEDFTDLTVQLVSARGLRNADWIGKSDAYVSLGFKGSIAELYRTRVVNDNLDPIWKEETTVKGVGSSQMLVFSVRDADLFTSDDLGWAQLPCSVLCSEGFNGELQLEDAGHKMAFIRVKVKPKGRDFPPGPPHEVGVVLKREPPELWGLNFDHQDGVHLHIHAVDADGIARRFNEVVPPEHQLKRGDFVVSVNGVMGDAHDLLELCKAKDTTSLELVVRRPHEFYVTVSLEGCRRGLPGLLLRETPRADSLIVQQVLPEWKPLLGERQVLALDRIVAINEVRGAARDLLRELKKAKDPVEITFMRPASKDAPC